jgi:fructosamine-3-kinase
VEKLKQLSEDVKRNIRESLVYSVYTSLSRNYQRRLVIHEFYHSLNRKAVLYNDEAQNEIEKALEQLEKL